MNLIKFVKIARPKELGRGFLAKKGIMRLLALQVLLAGLGLESTVAATVYNLFALSNGTVYLLTPNGTKSTFALGLPLGGYMACDSAGDLFTSDPAGGNIYKFTSNGVRSTFASGLAAPTGLACDSEGNLFVACDWELGGGVGKGSIIEITPGGTQSTFASGLNDPTGLAFDSAGNLYEGDSINNGTIYRYTPNGTQSVFASGFGQLEEADKYGLAFDSAGNLFVADLFSAVLFEFTPAGAKSTFGSGLNEPTGLAFDSAGDLFESDRGGGNINEFVNKNAELSPSCRTFASGLTGISAVALQSVPEPSTPPTVQNLFVKVGNGSSDTVYLYGPNGTKSTFASGLPIGSYMACDSAGDLYISDPFGGNINKFTPNGIRSTFASGLAAPTGLAYDSEGNLFVACDWELGGGVGKGSIIEITPGGIQSTFASGLNDPTGLAFDSAGNLYEADNINNGTIYKYTPNGTQSVFASGFSQPEEADKYGLAFDSAGNLFVADLFSTVLFEFTPAGTQSTFASGLNEPNGLGFDSAGDLFESDIGSGNINEFVNNRGTLETSYTTVASVGNPHGLVFQSVPEPFAPPTEQNLFAISGGVVYMLTANGTISTFASGFTTPVGLACDSAGDLFVSDGGNGAGVIYKFTPGGVRSTFASGLLPPNRLACDSAGNLFVTDWNNGIIYKFTANGTKSTFASGLSYPTGMACDSAGDVFVVDYGGNIYEYTPSGAKSTFASGLPSFVPYRLAIDDVGDVFAADVVAGTVYEFTPSGAESMFTSDLSSPAGLAFESAGDLFEADMGSGNINEYVNDDGVLSSSYRTFASGLTGLKDLVSQPVGNGPIDAVNDTAYVFDETPQIIDVLGNDSDQSGAALTVVSVTQGAHGNVTINSDGTVTYTPKVCQASLNLISPPAGQQFTANGVNINGLACGYLVTASGQTHAAVWQVGGAVTDLDPNGTFSTAESINDNGTVVGYEEIGGFEHAFVFPLGGQMTDLDSQLSGGNSSDAEVAYGINNDGQICGQIYVASSSQTLGFFLDNNNNVTYFPPLQGNYAYAAAVNNESSVVVGSASSAAGEDAFVWQPGDSQPNNLSSVFSIPTQYPDAVNDNGDIAGNTELASGSDNDFAFAIINNVFDDLSGGYWNSYAYGINIQDQIVGAWNSPQISGDRALFWEGPQSYDLNNLLPANSGWVLNEAVAINNNSLIVGQGTYQGQATSFATVAPTVYEGPDTFTYTVSDGTWTATVTVSVNVVDPNLDTDGDGLPDWWEMEYYNHLGVNPTGAGANGDGIDNYDDYLEGLNPNSTGIIPDNSGVFNALIVY